MTDSQAGHAPAHVIPCSDNFPRALARHLTAKHGNQLGSVAVVLPTRRLQSYVRIELAQELGVCVPPVLLTIDQHIRALPSRLDLRVIAPFEQQVIIDDLLKSRTWNHLRTGVAPDIARLFDEFEEADLGESVFDDLKSFYERDLFRDDSHLQLLFGHAEEMREMYRAWVAALKKHRFTSAARDIRMRVRDALQRWKSGPDPDNLHIAGFGDATVVQRRLLQRYASSASATFWFHADPAFLTRRDREDREHTPFGPMIQLLDHLPLDFSTDSKLPAGVSAPLVQHAFQPAGSTPRAPAAALHIHSCQSIVTEIKAAVSRCKRYVREEGLAPERIIIAVPDEDAYARLMTSVFAEAKLQANISLSRAVQETALGQWLRLFLDLVKDDWRLDDLRGLLINKYAIPWLAAMEIESSPETLQADVQRFARRYKIAKGKDRFRAERPETDPDLIAMGQRVRNFTDRLASQLAPFDVRAKHPLAEWAGFLWQLVEDLGIGESLPKLADDQAPLEIAALKSLAKAKNELMQLAGVLEAPYTFSDFYQLLRQTLFAARVHTAGEPFSGYQVMELREARSVPCNAMLILGNTEGRFPRPVGRELFLPDGYRRQLGMTWFAKREQLEDQTFYLLASAPNLHLFHSRQEGDQPAVRSRYLRRFDVLARMIPQAVIRIEEPGLLLKGDILAEPAFSTEFPEERTRLVRESRARVDARGKFAKNNRDLFQVLSATRIEDLLHCPYRFLLLKLGFGNADLPDEQVDNRDIGLWLHKVCETFFKGVPDSSGADGALRQPWEEPIEPGNRKNAHERLNALSRYFLEPYQIRLDHLYHMEYFGWPAFLDREMTRSSNAAGVTELSLEPATLHKMQLSGLSIGIDGRLDRVILERGALRVIDYKLHHRIKTAGKIVADPRPQLPLYLEMLKLDPRYAEADAGYGEYYALWEGEFVELGNDGKRPYLNEAWEAVTSALDIRLKALTGKQQPFAPTENERFCNNCEFNGICRRQEAPYREAGS